MRSRRDLHRQAAREAQAGQMRSAAETVRVRGPGGYAGLDEASAAAVSELLVEIAAGWREKPAAPRIWEAATRVADRVSEGDRDPAPYFPGPAPAGRENPNLKKGFPVD
ncbi:hypothetical protein Acsp06_54030 [Actinomycetospora sp. NBRC 106375]|uniref:hypothetical protein n=1 Tax=Actinomycetospora sp. NBRC 106375 TaxID=3032207 RepID=UPI0024A542D7|nr:hypothetical protein [Actinomycetospora sp. NBRC 106375]GLZ49218.1 hypothetical protein Acsp06_54030 [Actinomycetospora sp. NBRC 106375]